MIITDFQIYPALKVLQESKTLPDVRVVEYNARFEAAVPSSGAEMAGVLGYLASKLA